MGRKANNSELVDKLVKERWTMDDDEFEGKYNSLSLDDKVKVTEVINNMENELLDSSSGDDFKEYDSYDEWKQDN